MRWVWMVYMYDADLYIYILSGRSYTQRTQEYDDLYTEETHYKHFHTNTR